ncbi:MAG: ferredoxin-NADP reductase [Cyclobacteriaceae bacterium]
MNKHKEMETLQADKIKTQYKAEVLRSNRVTSDQMEEIREITLRVENPDFHCGINQCIGVLIEEPGLKFHHRFYTIAKVSSRETEKDRFTIMVKRCNYIDSFTGEEVQGLASNYLCDRKMGEQITITGPYPLPFEIPQDNYANMIMIGLGTGIVPFRGLIKYIHETRKTWNGKIRLFHGAKNGLELLYTNDKESDTAQYYDDNTYYALNDLSPRPYWMDTLTKSPEIEKRAEEILDLLWQSNTYVYVAGDKRILDNLETIFSTIIGSKVKWAIRKADLVRSKRWIEVIY